MKQFSSPNLDKNALEQAPAWRKMMRFYRFLKAGIRIMKIPWIGAYAQKAWLKEDADANWFIPIHQAIPTGQRYALPETLLERLLTEAEGIFAMAACPCRSAFNCQNYPVNLGCLHLGPAVQRLPLNVGRMLSLTEAHTHIKDALKAGLIPTILHLESDAEVFQVEKTELLSICFCCECCCDVRLLLRQGPERYWDLYNQRLPGLVVVVGPGCTGCGECILACYGGQRVISLVNGRAEINARCIGCGRCVPACPEGTISLVFDPDQDLVESLLKRISHRVSLSTPK